MYSRAAAFRSLATAANTVCEWVRIKVLRAAMPCQRGGFDVLRILISSTLGSFTKEVGKALVSLHRDRIQRDSGKSGG